MRFIVQSFLTGDSMKFQVEASGSQRTGSWNWPGGSRRTGAEVRTAGHRVRENRGNAPTGRLLTVSVGEIAVIHLSIVSDCRRPSKVCSKISDDITRPLASWWMSRARSAMVPWPPRKALPVDPLTPSSVSLSRPARCIFANPSLSPGKIPRASWIIPSSVS